MSTAKIICLQSALGKFRTLFVNAYAKLLAGSLNGEVFQFWLLLMPSLYVGPWKLTLIP
jgi:hypothetical protein